MKSWNGIVILIVAVVLVVALLLYIATLISHLKYRLQRINIEIERTEGEEQAHWLRQKKKLLLFGFFKKY